MCPGDPTPNPDPVPLRPYNGHLDIPANTNVPGEPPKTARVLRLFKKRRRNEEQRRLQNNRMPGHSPENKPDNKPEMNRKEPEVPNGHIPLKTIVDENEPEPKVMTPPKAQNVIVQVVIENHITIDRQQNTDDIII